MSTSKKKNPLPAQKRKVFTSLVKAFAGLRIQRGRTLDIPGLTIDSFEGEAKIEEELTELFASVFDCHTPCREKRARLEKVQNALGTARCVVDRLRDEKKELFEGKSLFSFGEHSDWSAVDTILEQLAGEAQFVCHKKLKEWTIIGPQAMRKMMNGEAKDKHLPKKLNKSVAAIIPWRRNYTEERLVCLIYTNEKLHEISIWDLLEEPVLLSAASELRSSIDAATAAYLRQFETIIHERYQPQNLEPANYVLRRYSPKENDENDDDYFSFSQRGIRIQLEEGLVTNPPGRTTTTTTTAGGDPPSDVLTSSEAAIRLNDIVTVVSAVNFVATQLTVGEGLRANLSAKDVHFAKVLYDNNASSSGRREKPNFNHIITPSSSSETFDDEGHVSDRFTLQELKMDVERRTQGTDDGGCTNLQHKGPRKRGREEEEEERSAIDQNEKKLLNMIFFIISEIFSSPQDQSDPNSLVKVLDEFIKEFDTLIMSLTNDEKALSSSLQSSQTSKAKKKGKEEDNEAIKGNGNQDPRQEEMPPKQKKKQQNTAGKDKGSPPAKNPLASKAKSTAKKSPSTTGKKKTQQVAGKKHPATQAAKKTTRVIKLSDIPAPPAVVTKPTGKKKPISNFVRWKSAITKRIPGGLKRCLASQFNDILVEAFKLRSKDQIIAEIYPKYRVGAQ